jgi:hypothetical protein
LDDLEWKLEYDFGSAYRQQAMDISAIVSIARALKTNASIQDIYMRFYSVSGPPAFDKLMLPAYSRAILHTTLKEFEKCQGTGDGAAKTQEADELQSRPSGGATK